MVNVGTAAGVQVFLPEPRLDPRRVLNCCAHVVPGAWEMEGHTQASGAVFRWLRDELGRDEVQRGEASGRSAYDRLAEEAATVAPGADGLLVLPTFNGTSAPEIRPNFRGAILGLTLAHTRAHITRAVLEGISLEIRWMLEAIRETGAEIAEVRLVGGGSLSPVWNQIHADVLGLPVTTLDMADAAVTGAAICAVVAMGYYPGFHAAAETFVRPRTRFERTTDNALFYDDLYGEYRHLVDTLDRGEVFARLGRGTRR
jgi:xylulokinase